jgi:predicted nucleotide-binding protein
MDSVEELNTIAKRLKRVASPLETDEVGKPLRAEQEAATQIGRAFSGSWLGYHSRVYYDGFQPPPPGANFSQEWGLRRSQGSWAEFAAEQIDTAVGALAGHPDRKLAEAAQNEANEVFDRLKDETNSILNLELSQRPDVYISRLKEELEKLELLTPFEIAQLRSPKGQIMTRDSLALGQGIKIPPHICIITEIDSIFQSFNVCRKAADICAKASSHIERRRRRTDAVARTGTNVFIGHGRSLLWRELKDFVHDRIGLPWDEFNRVPVAGVTNIARLSEMLDAAAIAFLIMTAEDEMAAGGVQARMNVVHEAGLFQGRLGFSRAIIVLEEGCSEFTNIQGLGQIRFGRGNISSVFEDIRRILEREELI